MFARSRGQQIADLIQDRLRTLRELPYSELLTLGADAGEDLVIDGREAGIAVFVERQSNGAVRVVVQGMVEGFFPFIRWGGADGFYKLPGGSVTSMTREELLACQP